jgi:hypothetical protein
MVSNPYGSMRENVQRREIAQISSQPRQIVGGRDVSDSRAAKTSGCSVSAKSPRAKYARPCCRLHYIAV